MIVRNTIDLLILSHIIIRFIFAQYFMEMIILKASTKFQPDRFKLFYVFLCFQQFITLYLLLYLFIDYS